MSEVAADRPVRWGIIGAGGVAHGFGTALRSMPDARIVAVASRRPESAHAFASTFGPMQVHLDASELVRDPLVDVVYVATPNHRHVHDTLLCLRHGKPVLCEKPFTLDAEQARAVVAEARHLGVFCMEAMWMRFVPAIRRAAELVEAGAIGEVRTLHADFSVRAPFDPHDRLFDPAMGGGALLDLGVYPLSLADLLLGPATLVSARAVMGATGVDEHLGVVTVHGDGRLATSTASLRATGPNQAVVAGTAGTLRIRGPICRPTRLDLSTSAESGSPATDSGRRRHVSVLDRAVRRVRARTRHLRVPLDGNGYEGEAAEVMRCLRDGLTESPSMPLDTSMRLMELVDDVRMCQGM